MRYPSRIIILCLAVIYTMACQHNDDQVPQKPNILFILSDDQRADALGAAGNTHIKTPHIDSLAENGVLFSNNFCMGGHHGAICAPSRAMILSGKSLFNVYDKLEGVTTMPEVFRQNGYATFGTGKWHNEQEAFARSFDVGKHIFFGGMSDHFLVPLRDLKEDSTYTETRYETYSTDLFADATIEFIKGHHAANPDQPFFSYLAFTAPHDPRSPHQKYLNQYNEADIPVPLNYRPMPAIDYGTLAIRDENLGAWPRTPEQIKKQLADYYALITHIDDRVGDIVSTLKSLGLFENTIIVYTADHGLAVGSHGLLGKQNLYEHSMQAPLIITGPGIPQNQQKAALTYLYDLFPTLADLAEIPLPDGVEGKSLTPILVGEKEQVRPAIFTAYTNQQRAIKNERWKLIRYPYLDYNELFDLENDPQELTNLAASNQHQNVLDSMLTLLKAHQQMYNDTANLHPTNTRSISVDISDYYRYPDVHQPTYTLLRYFSDVRRHPFSEIHYKMARSGRYGKKPVEGLMYNYNRLMHELKASAEVRQQYYEMIKKAKDDGIIKDIPANFQAFESWFID